MDQINVEINKAAVAADGLLKTDAPSNRKESEFPILEEWEMVLASGGEPAVCW